MDDSPSPTSPEATEQTEESAAQQPEVLESQELNDDAGDEPEVDPTTPLLSWQASEYIHHHKPMGWFIILFVVVVGLLVAGVLTHQWSSLAVLAAMTAAVVVYANKAPRTLTYSLTGEGVNIEDKFHPYSDFRSFAVISDVGWHTIDLDPVKRFAPRLTILFEDSDLEAIVTALSSQLPRVERAPDLIERASRYLKF